MRRNGRPADNRLNQSWRLIACCEGAANDGGEVLGRPSCLFRRFDDYGVPGKERGDDRIEEIVELLRLAHASDAGTVLSSYRVAATGQYLTLKVLG